MLKARKELIDLAIALDLVVIATGISLLVERPASAWTAVLYQLAVPFAAWKGGWRGGIAAAVASTLLLVPFFGAGDFLQGAIFVMFAVIVCAVVLYLVRSAVSEIFRAA